MASNDSTNDWRDKAISVPSKFHPEGRLEKFRETFAAKTNAKSFDELGYDSKRRRVLEEQGHQCAKCKVSEWFGKKLSLEIDHINGIRGDDRRENLEALCPNCHSITDTWRGRNKPVRNGEQKISDDELLRHLSEAKNIRQGLLAAGIAAKGNNYARAKKLLSSK